MTVFFENGAFLLLLAIAAAAVFRFRARRYLLVLIIGTAVSSWMIGYAFGSRWGAETRIEMIGSASSAAAAGPPLSPLWGLAFGVLVILTDYLVFGRDVRKRRRHGASDPASSMGREVLQQDAQPGRSSARATNAPLGTPAGNGR